MVTLFPRLEFDSADLWTARRFVQNRLLFSLENDARSSDSEVSCRRLFSRE